MVESLQLEADVEVVRSRCGVVPRVAIVAGSGLGGLAHAVTGACEIPYADLPGWPGASAIPGHEGRLVCGDIQGTPVAVFSGRVHGYQGVSALDAAFPARLAAGMGASVLIVTNAAGGVSGHMDPGSIVLMSDHINLTGANPLVGWTGNGGVPFISMTETYDSELRKLAVCSALELGIAIEPEGVYASVLGPSFETPAEVRMLRMIGADVVGMSTVHEVIVARALGMRVLGISLVTNAAAGHGLSHEEVLEIGARAAQRMESLVVGILDRLS